MERSVRSVAVQGEPGAYHVRATMQAARREGGPLYGVEQGGIVYCNTFREAIDLVNDDDPNRQPVDAAVVAINNNNLDDVEAVDGGPRKIMWREHESLWGNPRAQSRWCIVGEESLQINHNLLIADKTKNIHTLVTQLAAADQCPDNIAKLQKKHKGLKIQLVDDTAMAARMVAEWGINGELGYAAIASAEAGKMNGLRVLDERFQDEEINITRFLILQRRTNGLIVPEGANTTTLLMQTSSQYNAGALYRGLGPFADEGVGMSYIQSRFVKGTMFESRFWIETDVGYNDPDGRMQRSIERMREGGCEIHILGSYVKYPYPGEAVAA